MIISGMGGLRAAALLLLWCAALRAQATIAGRVVDETGAAVSGARVELRSAGAAVPDVAFSDRAGSFTMKLAPGDYGIRAERLGFYVYQGPAQHFDEGASELTITLNHQQEFSERVDVVASPAAIDPQQPADRKELDNTEIQAIPYPASQDYRNALAQMDGVVQDNAARLHFNGGDTNQTNYKMDGFNISNPVTGRLDTRVNMETIQAMDLESSRFSAENGRGSSGVLDIQTKMGDDRWRFLSTNFLPGFASTGGFHLNQWNPRLEFSGPIVPGRVWFHNGFDAFYSNEVVNGLPNGQNRAHAFSTNNLTRIQANLTPGNILTAGFLFNLADRSRVGLSFVTPIEATTNDHQSLYMSTLRDQWYFGHGALLDVGFADSRGTLNNVPQGIQLYEITPSGSRGNYFSHLNRHFYRQQEVANLFIPTRHLLGTHQLKFGIDFEREAFHQQTLRHDYEVLREDGSIARYVTFTGDSRVARKNFEQAQFIQDAWTPVEALHIEAGLRTEWNEVVRNLEVAPRVALGWAPGFLRDTKFSAGWGVYFDAISLNLISVNQDQESVSLFYPPGGGIRGPVTTSFAVNDQALRVPSYRTASVSAERKLPRAFYLRTGYTHRAGDRGFMFASPTSPLPAASGPSEIVFQLLNTRRERYDAFDISLRHTFFGQFEWFAGYTRSSARSNAAVDYSLENPVFGPQAPGPAAWDTPNRFHMWGWLPLPHRALPRSFRFLTRDTTVSYLMEYRTGFPFSVVDEDGFMVGAPNSLRMPDYFNINLAMERKFRFVHYLWAWRFGFNNLTNNGNPNYVNNVTGTPLFLTYARGQARAFNVRLRLLGRK